MEEHGTRNRSNRNALVMKTTSTKASGKLSVAHQVWNQRRRPSKRTRRARTNACTEAAADTSRPRPEGAPRPASVRSAQPAASIASKYTSTHHQRDRKTNANGGTNTPITAANQRFGMILPLSKVP